MYLLNLLWCIIPIVLFALGVFFGNKARKAKGKKQNVLRILGPVIAGLSLLATMLIALFVMMGLPSGGAV